MCQKPAAPKASSVDSCNDENGLIQMTATLRNVAGSYGQNADGVVTFNRAALTPKFSGNFLIMEKVLGGGDCTRTSVDGVDVCTQVAETVTLQCRYSLEEQTIADESFDVTGQDVAAIAENTGTLDYTLAVSDTNAIGDKVTFTITPKNAGLVYATIKSCDVTHASDELTIIGHGSDHCLNGVVSAEETTAGFTSNGPIQGAWTAFKWSTATASDDAESQGLKCKIELSQTASTDAVEPCTESNAACVDNDEGLWLYFDAPEGVTYQCSESAWRCRYDTKVRELCPRSCGICAPNPELTYLCVFDVDDESWEENWSRVLSSGESCSDTMPSNEEEIDGVCMQSKEFRTTCGCVCSEPPS